MSKERPILFNGDMVNAILAGRKTQTRRIVKPQRHPYGEIISADKVAEEVLGMTGAIRCPYGQPGDRLWVREAFRSRRVDNLPGDVAYRADCPGEKTVPNSYGRPWKPSIHMPRWASRITLEIVSVRVERLQNISEADAMAEGIELPENGTYRDYSVKPENNEGYDYCKSPVDSYRTLWEKINGSDSWDANPWVWVVEFKRVEASQ
ncbi:hypothetical protein Q9247_09490 [Halomonas meridiana]|uniref:hypothetical protein n=1 Tax=Vreelandella aquamarina TaxID=77097 RepID=UPI00273C5842|nr:hypothetical protein [Halomonas meridiana]MDP4557915.1 hypothetical protein [Halomonas meridiana]